MLEEIIGWAHDTYSPAVRESADSLVFASPPNGNAAIEHKKLHSDTSEWL